MIDAWVIVDHTDHTQQCSCLNDSAECCRPECDCHDLGDDE